MSFSNDTTTIIGKVRLYSGESDEETAMLSDEQITVCISDAASQVKLAAYNALMSKIAILSSNPTSQSFSTYSQSMDINSMLTLAARLKSDCEDAGIAVDGNSIAQFGRAEVSRTRRTHAQVEANKAARGESY